MIGFGIIPILLKAQHFIKLLTIITFSYVCILKSPALLRVGFYTKFAWAYLRHYQL